MGLIAEIHTLASYYRAVDEIKTFFTGWTRQQFTDWMILGRKNRGYRDALENLWLAMTEVNHEFEDIVMKELRKL